MAEIDWAKLEAQYITGAITMRVLAAQSRPAGITELAWRKRVEAYAKKNEWTAKRHAHRKGVVEKASEIVAEDDAAAIADLRRRERADLSRALDALDALLESVKNAHGDYLFDSMNGEQKAEFLEKYIRGREKVQNMLYRSFGIADKHELESRFFDMTKMPEEELRKYATRYTATA